MTIIAILADDLTGACDAAAPFARRGLATEVMLDAAVLPNAGAMPDVLALDVDTRRLGSKLAATRTGRTVRALRGRGVALLYKKIDSTLRGHVGVEIAATLRAWDAPLAIICSAFPAVGRWVQHGHLFVNGRGDLGAVALLAGLGDAPGEGEISAPAKPPPFLLDGDVVGRGTDAVLAALEDARRRRARVVIADAHTPAHLTTLAEASARLTPAALLVGSAGLATALAEIRAASGGASASTDGAADAAGRGRAESGALMPWLVLCGSQTDVSDDQVVELARAGAEVIELDVDALLSRRRAAEAAGARAARLLGAGHTPVLRLVVSPDSEGVRSRGARLDGRAARALGRACRAAIDGAQPAGLFVTGGLTARACLLALGATSLRLEREPLPGVAAGRARGGIWDGRPVVTKSGGFGAPDTIKRLVRPRQA